MTLYERAMLRAASMVIRLLLELIARQRIGISNVRLDQEALAYATLSVDAKTWQRKGRNERDAMKLARFLNYFSRVVSTNPKDPTVCFYVGDDQHVGALGRVRRGNERMEGEFQCERKRSRSAIEDDPERVRRQCMA
jgi:hypothetical protein